MIKIGYFNTLRIERFVDFGAYLVDPEVSEKKPGRDDKAPTVVLLPRRYLTDDMVVGDTIKVFVYTDSEDRAVATTETPYATVGEFAFLRVEQVNRIGAFLDWGLSKNLLVPFKEQKVKMRPEGTYLVYVYFDHASGRVAASARIEKFVGNVIPEYVRNERVTALVVASVGVGYRVIVDNLHFGMIYASEVYRPIEIGEKVEAYVKNVRRDDGRIDLTLTSPGTLGRVDKTAGQIIEALKAGDMNLTDNSTPEAIREMFQCSKKDFKKAIGKLYRERAIVIKEGRIEIAEQFHESATSKTDK